MPSRKVVPGSWFGASLITAAAILATLGGLGLATAFRSALPPLGATESSPHAETRLPASPIRNPSVPSPLPPTAPGLRQPTDQLAGPVSDDYLNQMLRQANPSNLEPATERQLLALATTALIADLTGIGREHFPDYLPGDPPPQIYTDVRVQAGVVRQLDNPASTVETHLMWAGTSPAGEKLERRTAFVRLRYLHDRWTPVVA